ncbi:MAG: YbhB/YbcL family Raf kinase inhibitor-like protein [Elusimicrobiales bacterium]
MKASAALVFCLACFACARQSGAGGTDALSAEGPAFAGGIIPDEYACNGGNKFPPLKLGGIPAKAKSLAVIMDDPDSPSGTWLHLAAFNIAVSSAVLETAGAPQGAVYGKNDFGNDRYDGPCPPSGTHRYVFHVCALDCILLLEAGASRRDIESAMKGHILARGTLTAKYTKR